MALIIGWLFPNSLAFLPCTSSGSKKPSIIFFNRKAGPFPLDMARILLIQVFGTQSSSPSASLIISAGGVCSSGTFSWKLTSKLLLLRYNFTNKVSAYIKSKNWYPSPKFGVSWSQDTRSVEARQLHYKSLLYIENVYLPYTTAVVAEWSKAFSFVLLIWRVQVWLLQGA